MKKDFFFVVTERIIVAVITKLIIIKDMSFDMNDFDVVISMVSVRVV
jgi:hypothetical protein